MVRLALVGLVDQAEVVAERNKLADRQLVCIAPDM